MLLNLIYIERNGLNHNKMFLMSTVGEQHNFILYTVYCFCLNLSWEIIIMSRTLSLLSKILDCINLQWTLDKSLLDKINNNKLLNNNKGKS